MVTPLFFKVFPYNIYLPASSRAHTNTQHKPSKTKNPVKLFKTPMGWASSKWVILNPGYERQNEYS